MKNFIYFVFILLHLLFYFSCKQTGETLTVANNIYNEKPTPTVTVTATPTP
ncbi:MAG: hypothetical protein N3E50_10380 [Candidatus Goldbacteria bacterium]|nr:hypothetical protein [Candidatus Goldiibacteriota bacterium]